MSKLTLNTWDEKSTGVNVLKAFRNASEHRARMEDKWRFSEELVYRTGGAGTGAHTQAGTDGYAAPDVNVSYIFKNFRYIHAQMSSNPPSVVMRPATSDQEDRRKADAADKVARYSMRQYQLQEHTDQTSLNTLLYGNGVLKTVWDATRGDITSFDRETREIEMEGDIVVSVPSMWNIYIDPDARSIATIKYIIERVYMDFDEAINRWPGKRDLLEAARAGENNQVQSPGLFGSSSSEDIKAQDKFYNMVELLEYWETGLPANGYMGRYCLTTAQGGTIEPCRYSPHRFTRAGTVAAIRRREDLSEEEKQKLIDRAPEQASLPYHILTDVDVPNSVYGKSFVEYAAPIQDNLNKIDSSMLENIQAHAAPRMIINDAAEVTEMANNTWEVTKVATNIPPYFMSPPTIMPEMAATRNNYIAGINEVSGVNESMFGQQSREQAAVAMQYAVNQGSMIRRRLFNKYVLFTESVFRGILNLVRKHWDLPRSVQVLGKEKALEAIEISGTDVDGGYDVIGEYGVSLSLDPTTRRQEIIQLEPMLQRAGIPTRKLMRFLKLSELESVFDEVQLAETRQQEIFDAIISTEQYIPPKPYRDHANMIAYALGYFMTSEFDSLPDELQQLCEQHIAERAQLAAQEQAGVAAQVESSAPPALMSPAAPTTAASAQTPEAPPVTNT